MKIIIVGGGQVGSYIANLLVENQNSVVVIENKEKALQALKNSGLNKECILIGDGTEAKILEKAGIKNCHALICATGQDETNLTVAMMAKFEYDVPKVVARVNNPKDSWLFNSGMGVDVKINQADIMTLIKLSKGEYSIVRVRVDYHSPNVNKSIAEIQLPAESLLIAVYEDENLIIPHGETIIRAGQYILALANNKAMEELNLIFGSKNS